MAKLGYDVTIKLVDNLNKLIKFTMLGTIYYEIKYC